MKPGDGFPRFSITGGALHRLGVRLRLVRPPHRVGLLGVAVGASLWTALVMLALLEGQWEALFSLAAIAAHVRLLLVIPLFFLCESIVAPRMASFVSVIVRANVVPVHAVPALRAEIAGARRRSESGLPEAACLAAAMIAAALGPGSEASGLVGLTGGWYETVCMTVFRFLVFRWFWRLAMWWYFLWRLSRLPLRLVPTHPDGAGGLGYLEVVHTQFMPLVFAICATQSAIYAEQIHAGMLTLEGVYPGVAILLVINAALFVLPLAIFTPALWRCRMRGLGDYMALAAHHMRDFDHKWIRGTEPRGELLGSPDMSSLADLGSSVALIRDMRLAPVGTRLLIEYTAAALLPLLPLLLFKYPFIELLQRVLAGLTGL